MVITLEMARQMIKAAIKQAEAMNILCSVAVVDQRGFLVALYRMDQAPIPTVDIARDKAWTAAAFRMPSSEVARFGDPQSPGAGFSTQNWNDRLTTIPGGLPVKDGEKVIGAVGAGGGTPEDDVTVCRAAMKSLRICR